MSDHGFVPWTTRGHFPTPLSLYLSLSLSFSPSLSLSPPLPAPPRASLRFSLSLVLSLLYRVTNNCFWTSALFWPTSSPREPLPFLLLTSPPSPPSPCCVDARRGGRAGREAPWAQAGFSEADQLAAVKQLAGGSRTVARDFDPRAPDIDAQGLRVRSLWLLTLRSLTLSSES